VYGSNSAGILGAANFASGSNDDGVFVTVTNAANYQFLDVTAQTRNVLLQQLSYTAGRLPGTLEPGTLGIVGLGGVVIGLLRRRNQN
jgi:hypothetical protein